MEIAGYGWNTGSGYRIIPEFSSLTKISVSGQEIMGFNRGTLSFRLGVLRPRFPASKLSSIPAVTFELSARAKRVSFQLALQGHCIQYFALTFSFELGAFSWCSAPLPITCRQFISVDDELSM